MPIVLTIPIVDVKENTNVTEEMNKVFKTKKLTTLKTIYLRD